jgi:ribose transport system substrate-binding protein
MKSSMKRFLMLLVVLLLAVSASACGSGGAAQQGSGSDSDAATDTATESKIKIGFSNGFSGNTWRAMMLASVNQEAAKYDDVEFTIVDGQNDVNKQVSDIESLIAMGVDGIMVIPNSSQAVEPVLAQARQKGIKVCVFNLPVEDPESYDIYFGTNAADKSAANTRWLVDKLGGKGNVVMLGGTAGNSYTALGIEGFNEAIEGTDINVLVYKDAEWSEDKAKMVMADILIAYDQIDGIWTDGGAMACGAAKAMLEAGRPLPPMTGDDYNGLFKIYLENKDTNPNFDIATISEPSWESRDAFRLLYSALKGETVEKDNFIVPDLITGADADRFAQPDMPDSLFVDNDLPVDVLADLVK